MKIFNYNQTIYLCNVIRPERAWSCKLQYGEAIVDTKIWTGCYQTRKKNSETCFWTISCVCIYIDFGIKMAKLMKLIDLPSPNCIQLIQVFLFIWLNTSYIWIRSCFQYFFSKSRISFRFFHQFKKNNGFSLIVRSFSTEAF